MSYGLTRLSLVSFDYEKNKNSHQEDARLFPESMIPDDIKICKHATRILHSGELRSIVEGITESIDRRKFEW